MDLTGLLERLGEANVLTAGGALIGLLFGFAAQRSSFCLRSAAIEFWRGHPGEKLAVWLLTFSAAVVGVQAMVLAGLIDVSSARQLAVRGSISGALVGGFLYGIVNFAAYYYLPNHAPAIIFATLIALLMVRPQGLFGLGATVRK